MSLCALMEQSALRTPRAVAVVHGARRITYEALWEMIQGAALRLRRAGLAPGQRVGLLLDNTPEYIIYYYGTLAAGGVIVPLNTASRARELAYQLRHCEASHWITDGRHAEAAAVARELPGVMALDAHATLPSGDCSVPEPAPEQTAAIIYTSGTTGQPKGVTLTHSNLTSNVRSILAYLDLGPQDVIVNVLPFHYSYGNSVLHTHIATGARLVLGPTLIYPQSVLEAMATERATGFSGVPSTFAILLARSNAECHSAPSLRYVTQAGGAMSPAAIKQVKGVWPQARFFVMYGQTEATARLTYLPPERLEEKLGSVGIPIPEVDISLRNEGGCEVPEGEVGEIWARGENIMAGYWNDCEATRQAIEDGWLKTGDLARQDSDGYIYIEGRKSEMIKSGAHRISPTEIESVLAELGDVEEAAVTGVPDELLGQVIKAVIVPRTGSAISAISVQRHCRERLPNFKVPKVVEFLSALPRTSSGKVQRYLLRSSS